MNKNKDLYGAIKFGEFKKYMQNKEAKLKEQEKEVRDRSSQELPQIFKGLSIHINGYTQPSAIELRRLILQHGGDYQHYLKKLHVTHILASNLTSAKMQEFRAYKVVKPNWITDSVNAKQLLPWQNYRLASKPNNQAELPSDWAKQTSTANAGFIQRYYETSRLHHLSTWKAELKELIGSMANKEDRKKQKKPFRIIMHVDFDCFFASVGIKDHPHLKDKPVAVTHSNGISDVSSSDIASCNYVARSFGVHNGMLVKTAKSLCPDIRVIPYEFEKYKSVSETFYKILFHYADEIQVASVDEALIDVSSHISTPYQGEEEALALKIRKEIRDATGCEVSIGIGPNILLARMSTKLAKPSNLFYCKTEKDKQELLSTQSVSDLPGVGYATTERLATMGVQTVSDLKNTSLQELKSKLGQKLGQTLYNFARGIDNRPLTVKQQRQSVSAEVNWGVRFESEENEKAFVYDLCQEVSNRLVKYNSRGRMITVKILKRQEGAKEPAKLLGHGQIDAFSKSCTLADYTHDADIISKHVYSMLKSFHFHYADIRGLGIQVTKLDQETTSDFQERLNFKRKITNEQESHKRTRVEANTKNNQAQLMNVDPDVFCQLPEHVQKEMMSNYKLVFQTKKVYSSQLAELPPWSQVDPEALLALPDEMREQVLKAYSNHKLKLPTKSNVARAKKNNDEVTLTQLFESKNSPLAIQDGLDGESIDMDVWNMLPSSIRKELLFDIEKKHKEEMRREDKAVKRKNDIRKPIIELPDEPSLQGLTDINDIRRLLREWVSTFDDGPEPEDVASIGSYLIELVNASHLEKAHLLMLYLQYLSKDHNDEWKAQVKTIQENLNRELVRLYQCSL
ncbi:deoxycytidyl transferase [Rhizopus azygosporus]|uniref:DNA repair protein REV1 n=1 Tax=Rhizopus azygosporus TaxID=86630 RepID=A0A367J8A1_RHIAZ|nr:deoxycytidyl transferase [Rhizopus azygosporus]